MAIPIPLIVGGLLGATAGGIAADQSGEDWWKGALLGGVTGGAGGAALAGGGAAAGAAGAGAAGSGTAGAGVAGAGLAGAEGVMGAAAPALAEGAAAPMVADAALASSQGAGLTGSTIGAGAESAAVPFSQQLAGSNAGAVNFVPSNMQAAATITPEKSLMTQMGESAAKSGAATLAGQAMTPEQTSYGQLQPIDFSSMSDQQVDLTPDEILALQNGGMFI